MTYYENIESFYEAHKDSLINGDLRPVVSYNKDAEEYINKLVKIYESSGCPNEITLKQLEKGLEVTEGSNVASTESPLTWSSLGLIVGSGDGVNKKNANYKYIFTDEFIELAQHKMTPGVHILNKLFAVDSLSKITKFINLLICTLREGYLEDCIIDFPRDNSEYLNTVSDKTKREEYSLRINRIYGYGIDTSKSPHASMRAINNLVKLELITQDGVNEYGFSQYKITQYGHRLLETIDKNLGGVKQTSLQTPTKKPIQAPIQQVFYGAPGTGKSHIICKDTKGYAVIRTTFHPDSDYSTFVGSYKPVMEDAEVQVVPVVVNNGISLEQNNGTYKEKRIKYKFVMQAFTKAYMSAWKKMTQANNDKEPQFLIIEEINRGNCAQIFGDLFQLLDRSENSFSTYPIDADTDLQQVICEAFKNSKEYQLEHNIDVEGAVKNYTSNYGFTLSEDIQNGRVLLLPPNLYIWATMNTSDQSLFPIDSAFKRRWDWKYIKIKEGKDNEGNKLGWVIDIVVKYANNEEKPLLWWDFVQRINEIIASMTSSADKQLGYFFCKATKKANDDDQNPTIITKEVFVSKVIFYLWNDVFKDYGFEDASLFRYKEVNTENGQEEEKDLTFPDFYDKEGENINEIRLKDFLERVIKWKKNNEELK